MAGTQEACDVIMTLRQHIIEVTNKGAGGSLPGAWIEPHLDCLLALKQVTDPLSMFISLPGNF